jgi:hypothetical protein
MDGCLTLFSSDEKVPGIPSHRVPGERDYCPAPTHVGEWLLPSEVS